MANLFQPSLSRATDANGNPIAAAKLFFYLSGTTTSASWFTDQSGEVPGTNPLEANASGIFAPAYLDPETTYRVRLTDAAGGVIWDVDPVRGQDIGAVQTAAQNAGASATAAASSAQSALASSNAAQTARTGAETAQALAEAARDIATDLGNAPIYGSLASLPTANGTRGWAIIPYGADQGIYEDVAGSPAAWARRADTNSVRAQAWAEGTEPGGVGTRSSKEWSQASANSAYRVSPMYPGITPSAAFDSLIRIENITDGIVPAGKVVYFTRFFWSGGNFRAALAYADDTSMTNAVLFADQLFSAPGFTGEQRVTIRNVADTADVVELLVNFGNGSAFATNIFSGGTPTEARISFDRVKTTPLQIAEQENRALAIVKRYFSDWAERSVTDRYMLDIIKDVRVEQADGGSGRYIVNYQTALIGGTTYRAKFFVRDAILGINVCAWELDSTDDISETQSATVFATQVNLGNPQPNYTGVTATFTIDWSKVVWATNSNVTAYTTYAQAGVRDDRVYTGQHMLEFLAHAKPVRTIRVASSGGDFTNIKTAIDSLHDVAGGSTTTSTYPMSNECTYSNQVLIEVGAGTFAMDGAVVPHFCTIRGQGKGKTILTATGNAGTGLPRVAEATFSCRFENLTMRQLGGGYVVHVDNANGVSIRATVGPAVIRMFIMTAFQDVRFESYAAGGSDWIIGAGISNGHIMLFDRCDFRMLGTSNAAQIGIHNTGFGDPPNTTDAGQVIVTNCTFNDATSTGGGPGIALLSNSAQDVLHTVTVTGSELREVSSGNVGGYTGATVFVRAGKWSGFTYTAELNPA